MIERFVVSEKAENLAKTLNKATIIGSVDLSKLALMALFEAVGCKVVKINSILYKSEKRNFRGKIGFTRKYKKFTITFDKEVDVLNMIKNISDRKIGFVS